MTRRWGSATILAAGLAASLVLAPTAAGAVLAVANDDQYSTPYETQLEVEEPGFLGNDLNVIGSTDPVITNGPDHGELNLHGHDGRFGYTPDGGFSGTDTFTYRLTTLLLGSTSATVRITVGPKPTPTPSPSPKPTATPKPTAAPAPTPTPRPSIVVLPSLELPLPSVRILPTPTPIPTPTSRPTASPTSLPTPGPSAAAPSPAPGPIAVAGSTGGSTGRGPSAGPGASSAADAAPVFDLPAARDDGLSSSVSIDAGLAVAPTFLVPTLAFTVPGLLVIIAVLAQGVGALAWIPFVKRTLGDDERDRRRRRTRVPVRR